MDLYDIVKKLVGPVHPCGDHRTDQDRLKNMRNLTELIDKLLFDVENAVHCADRQEASVKAIGVHAKNFMEDIKNIWHWQGMMSDPDWWGVSKRSQE